MDKHTEDALWTNTDTETIWTDTDTETKTKNIKKIKYKDTKAYMHDNQFLKACKTFNIPTVA